MELEEEFEITIPDEEAEKIKTVGEAIDYIEKAQGKRRRRRFERLCPQPVEFNIVKPLCRSARIARRKACVHRRRSSTAMMRRVVITGMGTVSPLAADLKIHWHGLLAGSSGIGPIDTVDTTDFKVKFGGEVKNLQPEKFFDSKTSRRMDRFAQFAIVAAMEAVQGQRPRPRQGRSLPLRLPSSAAASADCNEYEEQHTNFMQGGGPAASAPSSSRK